jgi:hypothetical protein
MSTDSDTDSSIELEHLIDKIKHLRIPNNSMAPNNKSTYLQSSVDKITRRYSSTV